MNKFTKFVVGAVAALALTLVVSTSASAAYTHTMTLKMGMTSSQVMSLQQTLNAHGFLVATVGAGSPGMESMYFGAKTKAAVVAFQAAKGLGADGVVGPMTGGALGGLMSGNFPAGCTSAAGYSTTTGLSCASNPSLPAGCTSTAGYSPVTGAPCNSTGNSGNTGGGLSGTDGTIENVTELSQYNNEEVGEGEEDVKIAGFEVETSNDGDVRIRSIRVEFDPTGNNSADSDRLEDYISGVKIWMGSTQVGSADADDFSESDDIYTATISLSNAIVRSDKEVEFFISVDGADNLDSGDIDSDSWTVDVLNARYEDGSGVVTTFDSITDLDVAFDVVDFSTSADTELKFSTDSDSPEAGIVMIDEDDGKDDVVLLKGKIKLDGDSDVNLDELPVTFSPVGENFNEIASSITLVIDGEEYSENVSSIADAASGTVVFDDLDLDISAGDTIEFEVRADINGTDGAMDDGDSLTASVTSTNVDNVDAENEQGDNLTTSDTTGSVVGEAQEFRSSGVMLTLVSTDTDVTPGNGSSDDLGTFKIRFKVKALDDTAYTSSVVANAVNYVVDRAGTSTTGGLSATLVNVTDSDLNSTGLYAVEGDEEETFELTVTVQLPTAGAAGQYRLSLTGFKWDDDSTDVTPDNTYTSNLDQFKTSYLGLN